MKPNPCRPRLVVMGVAMDGDEIKPRCYAAPDDGRPLEELMLCELRPWPAMDAQMMLARVMGHYTQEPK